MRLLPRVSALVGAFLFAASVAWIPAQPPTSGRDGGDASLLAIGKRWKVETLMAERSAPSTPSTSLLAIGKRWKVQLRA